MHQRMLAAMKLTLSIKNQKWEPTKKKMIRDSIAWSTLTQDYSVNKGRHLIAGATFNVFEEYDM